MHVCPSLLTPPRERTPSDTGLFALNDCCSYALDPLSPSHVPSPATNSFVSIWLPTRFPQSICASPGMHWIWMFWRMWRVPALFMLSGAVRPKPIADSVVEYFV